MKQIIFDGFVVVLEAGRHTNFTGAMELSIYTTGNSNLIHGLLVGEDDRTAVFSVELARKASHRSDAVVLQSARTDWLIQLPADQAEKLVLDVTAKL